MSNNPFKATIERLLNDEIHFFARQSPPIQQLGALADESPNLEALYAEVLDLRADAERDLIAYKQGLVAIAKFHHLPPHARTLRMMREVKPSSRMKLYLHHNFAKTSMIWEEMLQNTQVDPAQIDGLWCLFERLQDPPSLPQPALRRWGKALLISALGAVLGGTATHLYHKHQASRSQAQSLPPAPTTSQRQLPAPLDEEAPQ